MFDSKHHGRILILSIKTIFMTTTRPGIELAIRPLDSVWNSGLKSRKERPNPCRNDWDRSDWYNNLRPFLFPPSNREGGGRKMSPFTSKNGGGVIFWWIEKNNFWGGGGKIFFFVENYSKSTMVRSSSKNVSLFSFLGSYGVKFYLMTLA